MFGQIKLLRDVIATTAILAMMTLSAPGFAEIQFKRPPKVTEPPSPKVEKQNPEFTDLTSKFPRSLMSDQSLIAFAGRLLKIGGSMDDLREKMGEWTEKLNLDDRTGLSDEDMTIFRQLEFAAYRNNKFVEFFQHDLNGDLLVSRDELAAWARRSGGSPGFIVKTRQTRGNASLVAATRTYGAELSGLLNVDRDRNGYITVTEVMQQAHGELENRESAYSRYSLDRHMQLPRAMDIDGDGNISSDEIETSLSIAFSSVDQDKNGHVSQEEATAARFR